MHGITAYARKQIDNFTVKILLRGMVVSMTMEISLLMCVLSLTFFSGIVNAGIDVIFTVTLAYILIANEAWKACMRHCCPLRDTFAHSNMEKKISSWWPSLWEGLSNRKRTLGKSHMV